MAACAGARLREALSKETQDYIIAKPIAEVWPVVKQVLEDRRFPGFPKGNNPYHLETATLTSSGEAPGAETTGGGAAASRAAAAQGGRGAAGNRGMRAGPVDHAGGSVMRFVVDGEAVDETHSRVRVVRHSRDNIDSSESDIDRDADMEWEIISRLEPERADVIRKSLAAQGLEVP
jgi:hypothetical protein